MIGPEPPVPVTGDEASLSPYMTQEADPNTALRRTDSGGAIVRNLEVIDGILVVRGIRYTFPDTLEDNHFLQHTMDGELVWAPPEALLGSVDWNQIVNTPGSLSGYGIVPSTIDHGQISGLGDDDHTQYYRADGSRTLTGNANWGGFNLSAVGVLTVNNISASGVMTSTIVTGTPPFTIASTTLVTNLNADQLDSQHGAFYRDAGNLNAGTILSARLSGVYSGITGLGTQVQALDMGAKNITNAGAGTFAGTVTVANLKVSDTNAMGWVGHGGFESTSDGVFTLVNNARAIVGALSMGALTLSGALNMGTNNITNVGTYSGGAITVTDELTVTGVLSTGMGNPHLLLDNTNETIGDISVIAVGFHDNVNTAIFRPVAFGGQATGVTSGGNRNGFFGVWVADDDEVNLGADLRFKIDKTGAASFQGNAVSMGALVAATGEFSGNVGINESSPSRKLQVEGDGTANEIVAWFNNQGNFVTTVVLRTASRTGQWSIAGSIAGTAATGMLAGAMTFGHASGLSPIQFWNGNPASVKVTIMTGGNVLIGTTTDRGRLTVDGGGIVVGNPTGGDKGAGTMNVATDIFKNNTAYTNPDYVFELAHDRSARKIPYGYRIRNLEEIEAYTRAWYHLPGTHPNNPMGMFNRSDWLLEKVEETFLHLFAHQYRLSDFERRFKDHDSRIVRLENDNKELRELLNTQRN